MRKKSHVQFFALLLIIALITGLPTAAYASANTGSVKMENTDGSVEEDDFWKYGITLNTWCLDLSNPGEKANLSVEDIYPAAAEVIWSSDDPTVATVSSNGVVTAVGRGECTITVSLKAYPDISDECYVSVEKYAVTYHYGNGTAAKTKYYNGYSEVTLKSPAKKGYTFVGWYTDSKYNRKIKRISEDNTKNYNLYAKWKKTKKPGKPSIKLSSTSAGKLKVTVSKKASGATGYQLIVSKDKNLKKGNKKISISGTSKTLTGLTSGARYYVKVRAYTSDSTGAKLYGAYSSVKSLSVKKAASKSKASGSGGTVYITRTGEKYHSSGCRYLRQSKISISKSEAQRQGYTPCKVCKP